MEKKLLNQNQSGFRPSDSCLNQLLAITHDIFEAFDVNTFLEVRSVFLDISKAFHKVWHEGLLYKLKSMGNLKSQENFMTFLKTIYQTDFKELF